MFTITTEVQLHCSQWKRTQRCGHVITSIFSKALHNASDSAGAVYARLLKVRGFIEWVEFVLTDSPHSYHTSSSALLVHIKSKGRGKLLKRNVADTFITCDVTVSRKKKERAHFSPPEASYLA